MARHNYLTDLTFVEVFYKWDNTNGLLIEDKIPDDDVDFEFVYRAEDHRTFIASRKKGVYSNCKRLTENSVEVYIPLSRTPLGTGELIHELRLFTPNDMFPEKLKQTRIPRRTGLDLWKGASDQLSTTYRGAAVLEAILYGKSAWEMAKEKYGYTGSEEEYVMAPIIAAERAEKIADELQDIITSKTIDRIEASENESAGVGKTDDIIYLIFK